MPENGGDINLSWLTESLPNTLDKTLCLFETVFPPFRNEEGKILKIEGSRGFHGWLIKFILNVIRSQLKEKY